MVSFPYYSHTTPIRIPKDKRVPLLGVPENTIELIGSLPGHLQAFLPSRWCRMSSINSRALFLGNGENDIREGNLRFP